MLFLEIRCDRAWFDSLLALIDAELSLDVSSASALLPLNAISAFAGGLLAQLRGGYFSTHRFCDV